MIDLLIRDIVVGNKKFTEENKELLEAFSSGQKPYITLVSCSDSRLSGNILLENHCCRVFEIKNAGNRVYGSETSVLYGITHLKTPLVVILGHTDCGALKLCLSNIELAKNKFPEIAKIILNNDLLNFSDDEKLLALAELNVDEQISYLLSFKEVSELVKKGEVSILGCIYENKIVTGKRFRVISVNCAKSVESDLMNLLNFYKIPMERFYR